MLEIIIIFLCIKNYECSYAPRAYYLSNSRFNEYWTEKLELYQYKIESSLGNNKTLALASFYLGNSIFNKKIAIPITSTSQVILEEKKIEIRYSIAFF